MNTPFTDRYTVWSRFGDTANADDRPLLRQRDGSLAWPQFGSFNTRDIARFECDAEATDALAAAGHHRPGALARVVVFPFYESELQPS